jgi:hypothetical protein
MDAPPSIAFCLHNLAPPTQDRAGHSSAVLEVGIGGIDDGVHFLFGEVSGHQKQPLAGGQFLSAEDHGHAFLPGVPPLAPGSIA